MGATLIASALPRVPQGSHDGYRYTYLLEVGYYPSQALICMEVAAHALHSCSPGGSRTGSTRRD
jgi:hypothetical protein